MTAPTTRETADHIGEANEKVTADHAELARLAEAAAKGEWWSDDDVISHQEVSREDERFIYAFTPAVCSALLSEIAALRGEVAALDEMRGVVRVVTARATQAERQRDELRGEAVKGFALIHTMLMTPNVPRQSAGEVANTFLDRIANQGADQ